MSLSNLTFIEINTVSDLNNFLAWIDKQNKFPFHFYLNGITYSIPDILWRDLFVTGFEAGVGCGRQVKSV